MNHWRVALLLLTGFLLAGNVVAAEKGWSDEAELSFVNTGGNSKVTTLAAKNLLKVPISESFSGTWKLWGLYGKSDGIKNAESYATELRGDYAQTSRLFYYASAGWLQDIFSDIDNRYIYGLGVGFNLLDGPKNFLTGEAGVTYTFEKYTSGGDNDYIGGRLFGQYAYQFNDVNKFTQSVEYLPDFDDSENWLLNSETALVAALNSNFSMKTAYLVKYDNKTRPGVTKTDTIVSVALVANF